LDLGTLDENRPHSAWIGWLALPCRAFEAQRQQPQELDWIVRLGLVLDIDGWWVARIKGAQKLPTSYATISVRVVAARY